MLLLLARSVVGAENLDPVRGALPEDPARRRIRAVSRVTGRESWPGAGLQLGIVWAPVASVFRPCRRRRESAVNPRGGNCRMFTAKAALRSARQRNVATAAVAGHAT
jgi:hypothetical protein